MKKELDSWVYKNNFSLDDLKPNKRESIKVNKYFIFSEFVKENEFNKRKFKDYLFYEKVNVFSKLSYLIVDSEKNTKVRIIYYININKYLNYSDIDLIIKSITKLNNVQLYKILSLKMTR